jgi:hypothetical protein
MYKKQEIFEVKKFIVKLILLCFALVLADFIMGRTLKHYYFKINSGSLFHITFAIDSTNAETLVFGSSRAIHHYVPEIFSNELNTTFYNCGEDATGLIYSAALIKAVTARYKPKRILLDILPFEFSFDESDRLSKLLPYQDNPAIYPYILSISPYEKIKLVSQSYPFNSLVTSIISRNLSKDKVQTTEGYLELDGTIDSVKPLLSEEEGKIIHQKIKIYKDILNYLNQLHIPTYIVISPFYAEVVTSKSEVIAKKYCQTYKNVHFISFINRADYLKNYKLFKDFMHLNNFGAGKFSEELCEQIKIIEKKKGIK